jgi:hypothetical protein
VAGALRHQFLLKDGLLRRMGPGGSAWAARLLALLVVAIYFRHRDAGLRADVVANGGYTAAARAIARWQRHPRAAAEPRTRRRHRHGHRPEPPTPAAAAWWTIQPGGRLGFSVGRRRRAIAAAFPTGAARSSSTPTTPRARLAHNRPPRQRHARRRDAGRDAAGRATSRQPAPTRPHLALDFGPQTGPNRYSASGTLSLKGASKPQSLSFTLSGEGLRRRARASASIDRTAFGVGMGESAAEWPAR